ncbi:hypothetical protein BAMA_16240 [Bacillus manliponensis]|uniref:ORF6C domain-containing protein n=1 Tax=Bacillus manliponensis TaxID=574376 RepID=A0A073JSL0_9BACI|nr:Rha family transcriptional regulator [Bacillus manliponensis]KEK17242.1 hypothetical protein BAMA_16240 [Bacillus manliponensis]
MRGIQEIQGEVSELVFVEGRRIVTDSLTIAEVFRKRHDHVMRDIEIQIEKLIEAGEQQWGITNFGETQYQHPQNKQWYNKYNLTEDAFALVAMSYVTPEAMKMKVKFLQEFKRMKEFISKQRPSSREQFLATMQLGLQHEEDLKQLKTEVEQIKGDINQRMTVDYSQQQAIRNTVNRRVYELWEKEIVNKTIHDTRKKVFSAIWKDIKSSFAVNSYHNIRQKDFEEVIDYIKVWRPRLV